MNDFQPKKTSPSRLPLRGESVRTPRRTILASHLVFTGYAHWLSNDPRGSGSTEIRKDDLKDLGDIRPGRKSIQPPRDELRKFHRDAKTRLDHEVIWFHEEHRSVIGDAIGIAAQKHGYTLWAFAVCSNHAHAVVRTHRDRSEMIWNNLAIATSQLLRAKSLVAVDHPVWSHRVYKVFLYSPDDVIGRIDYVEENPEKEGLPRQNWAFVKPYPR
jgi:REP element-mobilizing transposase RayT